MMYQLSTVGCVLFLSLSIVNPGAQQAKELLLMAASPDDQKKWVQRLSKRVTKKGITGVGGGGGTGLDKSISGASSG